MTLNELMIKYNFISKVLLRDGDKELGKDLKVKIMTMRIKMGKVKKEFDEDLQEAVKGLTPEGYQELYVKKDKTKEEEAQLEKWDKQINDEYNSFIDQRGKEEVNLDTSITEDEFLEILETNAGSDVEINGQTIKAADFLEIFHSLFVE